MAEIINKEHKNVPPDKLREHPANPRQGDVGAIYESIKENGFYGTIVVQKSTGYVIVGNHRLKAVRQLGFDTVPVVYVDVDDERAMRILLADNRTNDLATYDDTALSQLLEHLASTDDGLAGTGYDGDYLDDLLRGLSDEEPKDAEAQVDRAEELKDEWQTETGQIWLIPSADGKRVHRLMCGDSTREYDVGRLLDGASIGAIVTDPPYGMAAVESSGVLSKKYKAIINDQDADVARWAVRMNSTVSDQIYWGANYYTDVLGPAPCWLVWDKNNGASDQMDAELAWTNLKGVTRIFKMASEKTNRYHPTQKPVELAAWCINKTSGLVLDLFAGAGWTLVAAENERRTCYAMEIDPGYVAVCLERLKGIGLQPELLKHSCA